MYGGLKGASKRQVGQDWGGGWLAPLAVLMAAVGIVLLAACGGDDKSTETPTATPEVSTAAPGVGEPETSSLPKPALQFLSQPLLPCHIDLAAAAEQRPPAEATPEVVRIQLLERPYRIVPGDIVLEQNRWYQFVLTTGSEWHSFAVEGVGPRRVVGVGARIDYIIPPGGKVETLVHTTNIGEFTMLDWRHRRIMLEKHTLTVIPQGASVSTWNSASCSSVTVHSPTVGASVSAPLVIQGTIVQPNDAQLNVHRIVAWSNGEQVGLASRDQFLSQGSHIDFNLSIPELAQGSHLLRLIGYEQSGRIAAAASFPLTILADPANTNPSRSYQGSIDVPTGEGLHSIPLTIQGWAVIPGSSIGTGVGSVEVWIGPRESGRFLTEATYGMYRPDVARVHGDPRFASSGFIAQLSNLPAGPVDLFVYVRERESGEYVSPPILKQPLSRRVSLVEGKVTDAAWPVALAAASDGRLFFAELLTGNIRVLQNGQVLPKPFAAIDDVTNFGESGFLGLALHPDFPQTPYVYAMYVVDDPATGFPSGQRVVRFRDVNNVGQDYTVILDNLPATKVYSHNGGRIVFGPDGKLYLTVGDTDVPELAQDPTRLEGSILRYNPDGSIPDDNPIPGSPVYATGLRNVFGLAFQPETGFLYATDNGPGGFDEVNKIEPGRNYGWPTHMGVAATEGIVDPIAVFGNYPELPIGPTGVAFAPERPDLLLFCAYHGFSLRALQLSGPNYDTVESTTVLSNNCALDITYSTDGWLYYSSVFAIYRARLDDLLRLREQNAQ